jgi:hypothetical protein
MPKYTGSCCTRNRRGLCITRLDCAAAAVRGVGGTGNKVVRVPRVSDISFAPAIYALAIRQNGPHTIPSVAVQHHQRTPVSLQTSTPLEQVSDHQLSPAWQPLHLKRIVLSLLPQSPFGYSSLADSSKFGYSLPLPDPGFPLLWVACRELLVATCEGWSWASLDLQEVWYLPCSVA